MGQLLGATQIREIAASIGVIPTKKLGQNFVVDANTCRRIVKIAELQSGDTALEIGPGLGSLTLAMLEVAKHVVAIEIDSRLAAQLPLTAEQNGFDPDALTVLHEDALTTQSLPIAPDVLVANLPYNVSVPVLLHFLEKFPTLRSGVVMVQSEVADRLVAKPGSKNYGSPSVKATWWADMSAAGGVGRSIFWPVPNVDSSLVHFLRHAPAGDEEQRLRVFEVIDAAFAQRRKMLRSALSELFSARGQKAEECIAAAGVDPTARGEVLILSEFMAIANTLASSN
jgi:16S rRNA (adenine1518-N6/adenine1519-N6)-dimethyltransferase